MPKPDINFLGGRTQKALTVDCCESEFHAKRPTRMSVALPTGMSALRMEALALRDRNVGVVGWE